MKNYYYQVVTTCKGIYDEWVYYSGEDLNAAIEKLEYEKHYEEEGGKYKTELRRFTLPNGKKFDDLTDEEKEEVFFSYDVIEG